MEGLTARVDPIVAQLVRRRKELGVSQRVLARKAGLAPSTINEVEHGYHSPTLTVLRAWSNALGIDINTRVKDMS